MEHMVQGDAVAGDGGPARPTGGTPPEALVEAEKAERPMVAPEAIVGVVFVGVAVLFGLLSKGLPSEAALYPRIVIVGLGLLSVALLIRGLARSSFRGSGATRDGGAKKFAFVAGTSLLYIALYGYLDFRVALFAFIAVSMPLWGLRWSWWKQLILAAALTAAVYYTFAVFFSVPLP